ncbi:MAG: LPXTG cell wall anchor domain-containing protein [Acidimicrobiia bacterium]
MRKIFGAALIATVSVFVLAPAIAGAQTTTTTFVPGEGAPPVPGDCTFSVTPNPVAALPANVTVAGTAPAGVTVELFVNGSTTPAATQTLAASPDPAPFSFPLTVTANNTQVDINYTYGSQNAYVQGCTDVAGTVVTRITVQTAGENVARPLAFTGSNNTPTYVIIGAAAIVVGLVLVVAARRRSRVHG